MIALQAGSTRAEARIAVKEEAKLDLDNYLPYLINRVGSIIAEQFGDETLAPHRLSIAMWRVMVVVASKGGQRQIDLAGLTSIEVSTLSRIVTRLMRMGLATRARSLSSTREVMVKLTPKGKSLVARLIPVARDYEAAAIAGLLPEELGLLKRCLRRVYANMKDRAASMDVAPQRRIAAGRPSAAAAEQIG